jgi:hypothetical protein
MKASSLEVVPTLMGEGAILMLFTSWGLLNTSTLAAESRTIKSLYICCCCY